MLVDVPRPFCPFFFNDTATTEIYTLSLHDALPISDCVLGFIDATLGPEGEELRSRPLANAAEFILRHLGEGIARHFMFPYNERSEEHTSELQSLAYLVCRLLLEKKKTNNS